MEVISRSLGFNIGDTHVSVTRRRYRLTSNPDFQLLHYTAVPVDAPKIPLQVTRIKNMPRDPLFFQKLVKQAGIPAAVPPPSVAAQHGSPTHANKKKAKVICFRDFILLKI